MSEETKCLRVSLPDIAVGRSVAISVDGRDFLVCRSRAGLHVVGRICPHQFKTLDDARVRGTSLICPHHGARFDLESGRSLSAVTPNAMEVFPCREIEGVVEIKIG